MASGDKLIDGLVFDPASANQGSSIVPNAPYNAQGVVAGEGTKGSPTNFWCRVKVEVAAVSESGVPDFDVEKQYKLTIEEV